jgi:hypothetical protein
MMYEQYKWRCLAVVVGFIGWLSSLVFWYLWVYGEGGSVRGWVVSVSILGPLAAFIINACLIEFKQSQEGPKKRKAKNKR